MYTISLILSGTYSRIGFAWIAGEAKIVGAIRAVEKLSMLARRIQR